MMKKARDILKMKIQATDGKIGHAEDIYFDDRAWTLRYIVVDSGFWLFGRKTLISPVSIRAVDFKDRLLELDLDKEHVKNSPPVDSDKPVSRQLEEQLSRHYNWPVYWARMGTAIAEDEGIREELPPYGEGDPDLRSAKELTGYFLEATDGSVGLVDDFLIDKDWVVRYIVCDTEEWLPGHRVIFSPEWINRIQWGRRCICLDTDRQSVKSSPGYDHSQPLDREYEKRLYQHYGRIGYWD